MSEEFGSLQQPLNLSAPYIQTLFSVLHSVARPLGGPSSDPVFYDPQFLVGARFFLDGQLRGPFWQIFQGRIASSH